MALHCLKSSQGCCSALACGGSPFIGPHLTFLAHVSTDMRMLTLAVVHGTVPVLPLLYKLE